MVGKKMKCHSMFPQVYAQKWKYQAINQVTLKNEKSENTNHLKQHKAAPFVFHDFIGLCHLFFSRYLINDQLKARNVFQTVESSMLSVTSPTTVQHRVQFVFFFTLSIRFVSNRELKEHWSHRLVRIRLERMWCKPLYLSPQWDTFTALFKCLKENSTGK